MARNKQMEKICHAYTEHKKAVINIYLSEKGDIKTKRGIYHNN